MLDTHGEETNNLSIGILKDIREKLDKPTNNFHRANLLRENAFVLFQESSKNSEELSSLVLDDVFKTYKSVVTSTGDGSVNNYTDRVVQLLKRSRKPVDLTKWKTSIVDRQSEVATVVSKCAGKFENCGRNEVTDIQLFRQAAESELPRRKLPEIRAETVVTEPQKILTKEFKEPIVHPPITLCKQLPSTYQVAGTNGPASINVEMTENDRVQPESTSLMNPFRTAFEELELQNLRKYGKRNDSNETTNPMYRPQQPIKIPERNPISAPQTCDQQPPLFSYGASKKSLGARRTVQSKFVPPFKSTAEGISNDTSGRSTDASTGAVIIDERLKNIDQKMVELISNEIMWKLKPVGWDDIAGLEYAKSTIQEAVVWPMLRPDIFTGLRRPPRGILLFGPPGTGKTLIGKCIASQSNSTFFSISASSLTSKWIGDGEKMVRALFAVAAVNQPSVIFIDEVDSLLCQRSETEHESSRRIKTEFLVQLDGAMTTDDDRILIVGATNRPQELDEAARRRFIRRLYIPLPEHQARIQILKNLLQSVRHSLCEMDIEKIGKLSHGYSGADMESLCREASMEPIRSIPPTQILYFNENEVRPINYTDFQKALNRIRASVSQQDLHQYVKWNEIYGSGGSC